MIVRRHLKSKDYLSLSNKLGVKLFALAMFFLVSPLYGKIQVGVKAEWDKPKTILMHTPRKEVYYGLFHPDAALFEDAFNRVAAKKEHRNYIAELEKEGVEVIKIVDVLMEGTLDEEGNPKPGQAFDDLVEFACRSLVYKMPSDWPTQTKEEQEAYKKTSLSKLHPRDLVNIIFARPKINLRYSNENNSQFVVERYHLTPLMNMHFLRDQQITTDKGIVLGKMNSLQRSHEINIMEFVFKKLGIDPIYKITGSGRLEGGDYIPAGDFALIGQGLRTNAEGIRQLLENNVFDFPEIAVVKDPFKHQDQMHLDTYFNIVGPKKAVVNTIRRTRGYIKKDNFIREIRPTVDVYKKNEDKYVKVKTDVDFFEYLAEKGFVIIDLEDSEQLNYGCNFLCVDHNKIIGVKGVSWTYPKKLQNSGVKTTLVNFENITKSYGGPHCTTQVIHRIPK